MNSTQPQTPNLYGYKPSLAMSVVGTVAFILVTSYLGFLILRNKTWFLFVFIFGAAMESVGYVARTISTVDTGNITAFLVQFLTIMQDPFPDAPSNPSLTLAQTGLAAGCYMIFGRLVWWISPAEKLKARFLWCPPRWITPIFVTFDLFSFFVQLIGISSVGQAYQGDNSPEDKQSKLDSGMRTLKFGLVLQLLCFCIFTIIGFRFSIVSKKWKVQSNDGQATIEPRKWKKLNLAVNGAATLITLRAIYRIFEFTGSNKVDSNSYLKTHEWVFWAFDAVPVLDKSQPWPQEHPTLLTGIVSILLILVVFPGQYLPHSFCRFRLNKKQVLKSKLQMPPPSYSLGSFDRSNMPSLTNLRVISN